MPGRAPAFFCKEGNYQQHDTTASISSGSTPAVDNLGMVGSGGNPWRGMAYSRMPAWGRAEGEVVEFLRRIFQGRYPKYRCVGQENYCGSDRFSRNRLD